MHSSIAAKHMNDRVLALNTLPGLLCIVLTQTHVGEMLKVATHTKIHCELFNLENQNSVLPSPLCKYIAVFVCTTSSLGTEDTHTLATAPWCLS